MQLLPGIALARSVRIGCEHRVTLPTETEVGRDDGDGFSVRPSMPDATTGEFRSPFNPAWSTDDEPRLANTWERYSPKARRTVRVVGDLRYFLYLALEGSPAIAKICEQPYRFRMFVEGSWVTSMFDIWCQAVDGQEYYFDAFYLRKLKAVEVGSPFWRQLKARELWAAKNSLRYAICTEKTLLRYPQEISNWTSILSYLSAARECLDQELGHRIRRCVEAKGAITLGGIATQFPEVDSELVATAVFTELHAGNIVADLRTASLSISTIFSRLVSSV